MPFCVIIHRRGTAQSPILSTSPLPLLLAGCPMRAPLCFIACHFRFLCQAPSLLAYFWWLVCCRLSARLPGNAVQPLRLSWLTHTHTHTQHMEGVAQLYIRYGKIYIRISDAHFYQAQITAPHWTTPQPHTPRTNCKRAAAVITMPHSAGQQKEDKQTVEPTGRRKVLQCPKECHTQPGTGIHTQTRHIESESVCDSGATPTQTSNDFNCCHRLQDILASGVVHLQPAMVVCITVLNTRFIYFK